MKPGNEEAFQKRLKEGRRFEAKVAKFLRKNGIKCSCPTVRKDHTKREIDILLEDGRVIEVKSRKSTCKFTSIDDWPFPDVFVDTEQGWERKEIKPVAYIIISQDTGSMLWIDGSTRDQWITKKVFDRYLGYDSYTLCSPKELLRRIDELVDFLSQNGTVDNGINGV